MGKNTSIALWVLIVILGILVFGYLSSVGVFEKVRKTGQATQDKAETIADIAIYFEIELSDNLTNPGIEFDINRLPTLTDPGDNATLNYDASDQTLYWVQNIVSSNTPVDLCIRANNTLIEQNNPNYRIGIGNYTWANSSNNNINEPSRSNYVRFQNSSESSGDEWWDGSYAVPIGSNQYFRFFLNVSDAQEAGIYRTWVEFKAIPDENSCT
jgi:hypothetical protein